MRAGMESRLAVGWGRAKKKGGEKLRLVDPHSGSGFEHDHDRRLLLIAEYRDARGLPDNILLRIPQEVLQILDGLSIECQQDITGKKTGFGSITCVGYFEQDHARLTWTSCG